MKIRTSPMWLATCMLTAMIVLSSFVNDNLNIGQTRINSAMKYAVVAGNYKELIIKVNEVNGKNLDEVRAAIESNGGVIFKGYCPGMQVLMYLVNRDIHPDNSFLVKLSSLSYTYEIKEGSITQVCAECGIEPVISETE